MIYVQFDSMLAEYKLCCVLDLFDLDAQKNDCMHEIISCSETHFNNTFSPENHIFCADEFQLCGVNSSFPSFLDLSLRFHCNFREQQLYRQFLGMKRS